MKYYLAIFGLLFSLNTHANEQDTINIMVDEINATRPLIDESRARTDRQDRFRFEYHKLLSDLEIIKQGLRSAMYGKQRGQFMPRTLHGDYGTVGRVGEAETLQMLIRELQAVTALTKRAEYYQKQENHQIRHINYGFIRNDLLTIISGIQIALSGSSNTPRSFPALRGQRS